MNPTEIAELYQLVNEQGLFATQDYCSTATAVLLIWHYITTFDQEVHLFWKWRPTGACILFLANRYLTLVVSVFNSPWWSLATTYDGCVTVFILEYSQYIIWGVFSCLRVYALSRKKSWAALVLMLSFTPVISNGIPLRFMHIFADPVGGCSSTVDISTSLSLGRKLDVLSRVCLVLSDFIAVIITWSVTYRYREHKQILGMTSSFSSVLYRDGSIYFLVLTVLNILHLLFSMLSVGYTHFPPLHRANALGMELASADSSQDRGSLLVRFIEPLTAILISRFLIDLQEAATSPLSVWMSNSSMSAIGFVPYDADLSDSGCDDEHAESAGIGPGRIVLEEKMSRTRSALSLHEGPGDV
ncbi:hypothetical protein C8Q79DRAFT_1014024 [Trametes meyenii]|nr:hypothetical protein C8Q79DRAFT_1014024 [Trametes meyenii]